MTEHHLVPAYGRDYHNTICILDDFDRNKDFVIVDEFARWNGKPISRDQMEDGDTVRVRYGNLRHVFVFTIDKSAKWDLVEHLTPAMKKGLHDAARGLRVGNKTRDVLVQLGLLSRAGTVTTRGLKTLEEIEKRSAETARLA